MGNIIAWQDKKDLVTIDFNETNEWTELDPVIKSENKEIAVQSIDWLNSQTARLTLQKDLPLGSQAKLIWGENEWPIYPRNIVKTRWFDQTFDASSEQLGPVYSKEKTSFSVWHLLLIKWILFYKNIELK
ncbi:hypothetical protein JCM21714_3399 [Gracilibacillus boraciitolerans JCM 21714]|uniref:Uncharacterized protein n=1 Tax=Gracilibacillus boraciitolerans JCM 21714 TaxID=1298598 RepID=W4VND0_9BACI|nr:hypothetical protein [Gracilibacillus boraciitolerans]GAE94259.1 hypothetical protein JCM21714_3399 [Gracilibacillus boraciitolerans JCM 21714]